MTLKELYAKAGPLSSYGLYIVLAFLSYLVSAVFFSTQLVLPEGPLQVFLSLGYSLLISPMLTAGIYGGIHAQQRNDGTLSVGAFVNGLKLHYGRMLLASFLSLAFFFAVAIFLSVFSGTAELELFGIQLLDLLDVPSAALTLFWFSAIVLERKIFPALLSAIKLFLFNPFALLLGIVWGAVRLLDSLVLDSALIKQAPVLIYLLPAAIYATLRIMAVAHGLAIYKQIHGEGIDAAQEQENLRAEAGDGLAKVGFGFAFVSFLPLAHLAALVLGILALRRKKKFVMRAAIACLMGGFFTIFYFLVLVGALVVNLFPAKDQNIGYSFLTESNASLRPQVALLEQGDFQEVRQQLELDTASGAARHWTVDGTLAIAAFNDGLFPDRKAALEYFYTAAGKKPDQAEFYYYYGLTLLYDGQLERAGEQFTTALKLDPRLAVAQKYQTLVQTAYYPPETISALLFIVILLISFTVHEYGHTYAAWKLGDDTAKDLGRLTLNPAAHLDLFGSIILPGIMLMQQTGMVFGWAKPVPVDPRNFRDPRKDHMIVSFAGPATNLLIAMASFILLGLLMLFVRVFWPETITLDLATPYQAISIVGPPFAKALIVIVLFIKQVFYTSLILGCLNLLPFPPLDGSWILAGLLPGRLGEFFEKIRAFGPIIFLLLIISPVLDFLLAVPMGAAWGAFVLLFSALGVG